MGSADEEPGRFGRELRERCGLLERRRHRLLDEHVLAGAERSTRERAVHRHARQHEDDVDVVALDHRLGARQAGIHAQPLPGRPALALIEVVDRRDARAPRRRKALHHAHVGAVEDASEPEDADADRSLAHGRDASTAMECAPLPIP